MGEFGRRSSQAWSGTVEAFLADRRVSASTAARYQSTLGELGRYLGGRADVGGVAGHSAIWDYVQGLAARNLSPTTTAAHLRRVRTFLEWLEPSPVPSTVAPPEWAFVDVLVGRFDRLAGSQPNAEVHFGEAVLTPIVVTSPSCTSEGRSDM